MILGMYDIDHEVFPSTSAHHSDMREKIIFTNKEEGIQF